MEDYVMSSRLRAASTTLVAMGLLIVASQTGLMQGQAQRGGGGQGQQPAPPAWSEDQIKQAMAIARVGRRLTPKSWPNGAKVAVSIGYDVDNMGIGRGAPLPAAASSGEYGAVDGLPRILALLDRQQLPATFFMPASSAI